MLNLADVLILLNFFKKRKLYNKNINNTETNPQHTNRGIEFILKKNKRRQTNQFHLIYEKMVCLFKRELTIFFEFSINIRKR